MSRLRELRLHGFKTFADPTRFVFEPGVNAVIGPNGSGKSNMADAVRWVLGEQSNRSLRTRRADDVIFTGSQQRKATGLAEVILTMDNADGWLPIEFAEVTIGRRAYRSGEGEYLINGARARLRDVVELLAAGQLGANSLVVVGQGTVDAALSLRPEERRQLFEEAAGVKNLQVRKNEALGRLTRAEENLTRVNDLLGELRPQVRRLALQAQHQQEHDTLRQRGRAVVLESHERREREIRGALGDAHRRTAAAEVAAEAIRAENASSQEALAAAEGAYWEAEAVARRAAEEREATREAVIRLESRVEAMEARGRELAAARERAEAELKRLEEAGADDSHDAGIAAAMEAARTAEQRWQDTIKALEEADLELVAAEEALGDARRQDAEQLAAAARRREEEAEAIARRERLEREIAAARDELAAAEATLGDRAGDEEVRGRAAALRGTLAEAERAADGAHAHAAELRQQATALAERLAAVEASLGALADAAELQGGLGRRLADSGWRPLVDALRAPDAAWPAIEAVVGGELAEALLWREGDAASATLDARGVARLLDGRSGPDAAERGEALAAVRASRTLAEWIATTSGGPSPAIFQRVALAPDLDALMSGWRSLPAGWCAVTAQGDLADGRGMIALRGRADPPGGEGARRLARRGELATEAARLRTDHEAATNRAAQAVAEAAGLERRRAELRGQVADTERAVRLADDERQSAEARRARAAQDVDRLESQLRALPTMEGAPGDKPDVTHTSERAPLEARAANARRQREETAAERDVARAAWQSARAHADELERAAGERRRTRAELDARRAQLRATIEASSAAANGQPADELAQELAAARIADETANGRRRQAEAERERLRARLLELERSGTGAGARMQEAERALATTAIEVSRHEEALAALGRERAMALDALEGGAFDDEEPRAAEAPVDDALVAELAALDAEALAVEERRVRRTLAQIGSVNPFALEEHREQSARLEEMSGQEADLSAAIGSTRELIATLDAEIGERFGAAFRAIGTRFDEFVQLLFAGGSASIEVGEGEDGEAGGIEIVVRPPGKRPQRLSMLSGGERALTGVALLFAMLSVNPVPFCILDEVDAALDEANIGRFAQALRRLSEQIDFVVITHNRATIEVADTIYGVTMTDAAVSRVLSLRLADVPTDGESSTVDVGTDDERSLTDAVAEVTA